MKKLLTYCGILASFVFLLALNTDVLSKKAYNELECSEKEYCYYTPSQGEPLGHCFMYTLPNTRICRHNYPPFNHPCVGCDMTGCCWLDWPGCRVYFKEDEGDDPIIEWDDNK